MTDQVGVRHARLVTHAAVVDGVGDRVTTAAQAGAAVRAGNDAYGRLCVLMPDMLNALQDILIDGINAAADSLHDTGTRLRATASEYESTDRRRAEVFKAIHNAR